MNLIFRMLYLWLASYFKPRLPTVKPRNSLILRVLPNDIDLNWHMNNGRYLTVCDLSRVDMFLRSGLGATMWHERWIPIIAEHTMTYKKGLRLFQKYRLDMDIVSWDERAFYMQHRFYVAERIVAEGTSKGVIVSKTEGVIAPQRVMDTVDARRQGKQ